MMMRRRPKSSVHEVPGTTPHLPRRLRAELDNVRLSQGKGAGSAGQNYQSGRGSR